MVNKGKSCAAMLDLPSVFDLDAESMRLNELSEKVKIRRFSHGGHTDSVVPLVKLRKYAVALMISASNAIDREKMEQVELRMSKVVEAQQKNHDTVVAQVRLQHQGKMRELESARDFVEQERMTLEQERMSLAELRVRYEKLNADLEYARKKVPAMESGTAIAASVDRQIVTLHTANPDTHEENICQICFERERDSVILTCMHFQYCSQCLELHKLRDGKCPTCRQQINGILKLRS